MFNLNHHNKKYDGSMGMIRNIQLCWTQFKSTWWRKNQSLKDWLGYCKATMYHNCNNQEQNNCWDQKVNLITACFKIVFDKYFTDEQVRKIYEAEDNEEGTERTKVLGHIQISKL